MRPAFTRGSKLSVDRHGHRQPMLGDLRSRTANVLACPAFAEIRRSYDTKKGRAQGGECKSLRANARSSEHLRYARALGT